MKQVLEFLTADVNAKGGVAGKQLTLVTEDDGSDPRTAALAANKLISQGVVAVIGTYGSSVTEPTQGIFDEAGVVEIANGATAIRLTEKGLKMFFRTCPRDDEQGKVAAQAIAKLGNKRVAFLHDNSTYAKGLATEAKGPWSRSSRAPGCLLRRSYSRRARLQHDSDQAEAGQPQPGILYRLL